MTPDSGNILEYWYNDDYENRHAKQMPQIEATFDGFLNVEDMPTGFNRFYFRVANGTVYSHYVLRIGADRGNTLEYWFDDNVSQTYSTSTNVYAQSVTLLQEVDVSDLSDGTHRIYYRITNGQNKHGTVYSDWFFKGDYNGNNLGQADITAVKYWVDKNKSGAFTTTNQNPAPNVNYVKLVDMDSVAFGNHEFHIQFMNNYGVWSEVVTQRFEKPEYEHGGITLTATVEKDMVKLDWNSLPDVSYYQIWRDKTSTTTEKSNVHPKDFSANDYPALGTYTYKVEAHSADNKKIYVSNEQQVTISNSASNKKEGTLLVYVQDPDGNFIEGVNLEYKAKGLLHEHTDKYITSANIAKITIPFLRNYEEKDKVTVNVEAAKEGYVITHEGSNFKELSVAAPSATVRFLATPVVEAPVTVKDIEMASSIHDNIHYDADGYYDFADNTFNITLRNVSGSVWNGIIYMKVTGMGEKTTGDYVVSFDNIPHVNVTDWQPATLNFLGTSLTGGEKQFEFDFSRYAGQFQNGNFLIAFYSQQKMGNVLIGQKLVRANDNYVNPCFVAPNAAGNSNIDISANEITVVNSAVEDILKALLNKGNNIYKHLSAMNQMMLESNVTNPQLGDVLAGLDDWWRRDEMTRGILSNASLYFLNDQEQLDKIKKKLDEVGNVLNRIQEAKSVIKDLQTILNFIEGKETIGGKVEEFLDQTDQMEPKLYFTILKKISSKIGGTFYTQIFEPYFQVGEAMLTEIQNMESFLFDHYNIAGWGTGAGSLGLGKIDIVVKKKWRLIDGLSNKFSGEAVDRQIKEIKLYACASSSGHCSQLIGGGDSFQVNVTRGVPKSDASSWTVDAELSGKAVPTSAQIKITWANGRISWVPVNSKVFRRNNDASGYTIEFDSDMFLEKHMADKIKLVIK
jgi:hypothetical protein